jgi:hypothetical protein
MNRTERGKARALLLATFGENVEIDTDADGDLLIDVDHADGSHTRGSITSLHCAALLSLNAG